MSFLIEKAVEDASVVLYNEMDRDRRSRRLQSGEHPYGEKGENMARSNTKYEANRGEIIRIFRDRNLGEVSEVKALGHGEF